MGWGLGEVISSQVSSGRTVEGKGEDESESESESERTPTRPRHLTSSPSRRYERWTGGTRLSARLIHKGQHQKSTFKSLSSVSRFDVPETPGDGSCYLQCPFVRRKRPPSRYPYGYAVASSSSTTFLVLAKGLCIFAGRTPPGTFYQASAPPYGVVYIGEQTERTGADMV